MILLKSLTHGSVLCAAALYSFFGGCNIGPQTPPGDTITVEGPANDTVQWQAVPTVAACCNTSQCHDIGVEPVPSAPVNADGLVTVGTFPKFVDDTSYTVVSTAGPTPCMGIAPVGTLFCEMNFTLSCTPTPSGAAQGRATVTGTEDSTTYEKCARWFDGGDCAKWEAVDVYNHGVVSLTLNGQTVSVSYGESSTAFSVGAALALAIDQNSTLASQLISAGNGPVAYVAARNTGTQYDYPWTTSCTYYTTYFSACSFSIALSPSASLASPPGPQ